MPDTPLGQIVSIRAEKDSKKLKSFTKEQRKIWREWRMRKNKKNSNSIPQGNKLLLEMQQELKKAFS